MGTKESAIKEEGITIASIEFVVVMVLTRWSKGGHISRCSLHAYL